MKRDHAPKAHLSGSLGQSPKKRDHAPKRRVFVLAAIWVGVMAGIVLVPGCFTANCEGSSESWGRRENEGRLVDENTWESTPVDAEWLYFPHQRFWDFDLRLLGEREPSVIIPYVSANPRPIVTNDPFVVGAGNIVEITAATKGRVVLKNGTCADYYLRLVVQSSPRPGVLDGGAPSSSSSSEAGTPADAARD